KQRAFYLVDTEIVPEDFRNSGVNVVCCPTMSDLRGRTDRQPLDAFRIVALVRAADQRSVEAEGAHDLGGTREERNDSGGHALRNIGMVRSLIAKIPKRQAVKIASEASVLPKNGMAAM